MDLGRFRYYTAWHHEANREQYIAPADPWQHISVDPNSIDSYCSALRLDMGLGRVQGGDWDQTTDPLAETATRTGLRERFEEGKAWEQTAVYDRAKEHFESGGDHFRGYESLAAFLEKRLTYIDDLYNSIKTEGYRSNAAATHDNPHAETNEFEGAYANHLDPLVAIGRDGELIWVEGYHRLIIARILGIESIPVLVCCRHVEWQHTRDRIQETPTAQLPSELDDYLDHPDVQCLR